MGRIRDPIQELLSLASAQRPASRCALRQGLLQSPAFIVGIGENSLLEPSDYPFASEFYVVEKSVEIQVKIRRLCS